MKTILLSLAGAAISLATIFGMQYYKAHSRTVSATPIEVENFIPTIFVDPQTADSQISSDGTKKLTMKTVSDKNTAKIYTFSTSDGSGADERVVFRKTLDIQSKMSVPYNTWSPDNKYFFIQEETEEGKTVMVFNASGEPFENQENYLDLTDLYKKRNYTNTFSEATGWAAPNLVIFNTTTQDNAKGPSYWFEVPSGAIIQLSLQF